MYEQYGSKDIFVIKAKCLTVGIDFYKEITTDTDFISVMGGILHSPEVLARLDKQIAEKEKTLQAEISKKVKEREEDEHSKRINAFAEMVKTLSTEELNKRLIDSILTFTYNTDPVYNKLSLAELLAGHGISLREMDNLVKSTSTDHLEIKTKVLFSLENEYKYYNDSDSGHRWAQDVVRPFLNAVSKINKLGYIVCFRSRRMFGDDKEIYAYDLLDRIISAPTWPSSKYLLNKCISVLQDKEYDKISSNLIVHLD